MEGGTYLAGAAGGGGTLSTMMNGIVVDLWTTIVEEEELLGGEIFGLCCPLTIELQSGRGNQFYFSTRFQKGQAPSTYLKILFPTTTQK